MAARNSNPYYPAHKEPLMEPHNLSHHDQDYLVDECL